MLDRKPQGLPRALAMLMVMLFLTACGNGDDTNAMDQAGIVRVIKTINQSHNQGVLTMDQLRDHYTALQRYTGDKPHTRGVGAMGSFYAHNLGRLYREFVSLKDPEAFLVIHTTVKTGEAYIQDSGAFAGENTLTALKQRQQEFLERYRD